MLWVRPPPGLLDTARSTSGDVAGLSRREEGIETPTGCSPFRGRLTAGRRALDPPVLVRLQPPELCLGGETDPSRLGPNEQVQVRLLAGVLTIASVVKRTSRGSAKSEVLVRLRAEALWPNPKRQREPALNRRRVGSTPTGHPNTPAMPDRPGTAFVTRT